MNVQEAKTKYPEIQALYDLIEKLALQIEALETPPELEEISFSLVRIQFNGIDKTIRVEDEYKDVENATPALLLQLLLNSCDEYEEHEDFLVWCRALGLNASDSQSLSIYKEIAEVAALMARLGVDYNTYISPFDWELNAGAAQALRSLSK